MPLDFAAATAVTRRSDGIYDAAIAPGWDILGNANGGYVIALAARAMAEAVGRPPLTITAHYLAPGLPGPVEVDVDVVRDGRRTATVSAQVRSESGPVLVLLGTFAEQRSGDVITIDGAPPELPPIGECVEASPPVTTGFHDQVRSVVRPVDAGFKAGEPSGTADIAGWFEIPGVEQLDVFAVLMAADAFAPVVFQRPESPVGWAPTLELTVHVRGVPAPGPLRCRFFSQFISDGLFDESGELWDANGQLVAQSRQLALVPRGMPA